MLSDTQKEELKNWDDYDNIFVCRKCNKVFGSDLKVEDAICSSCNQKIKKKVEK